MNKVDLYFLEGLYVEKIADKINGITVSGDRKVMDGLKEIFAVGK